MVITLDFESSDPGSSPGRTFFSVHYNNNILLVAQYRQTTTYAIEFATRVLDLYGEVKTLSFLIVC